jgi:SAM-dependent methyltransferase
MSDQPTFDRYADDYDASLALALELSGEDRMFYAKGRVSWLDRCLRELKFAPLRGLDYGCGVGTTSPLLADRFGLAQTIGVDVSPRSIELARAKESSQRCSFFLMDEYRPDASLDLAYCNGVFHHIPLAQRLGAAKYVHDALCPGGIFAFWENFGWNPGTRYVMAHCVFDKDAITLTPGQGRRLLRAAGFEIVRTDFAFVFPRLLRVLRPLEKFLSKLPLGAQYQILARKPLIRTGKPRGDLYR